MQPTGSFCVISVKDLFYEGLKVKPATTKNQNYINGCHGNPSNNFHKSPIRLQVPNQYTYRVWQVDKKYPANCEFYHSPILSLLTFDLV